jgi:hypothetical protein
MALRIDVLDDESCKTLMKKFIDEKPELWDEDIAGGGNVETEGPTSSHARRA